MLKPMLVPFNALLDGCRAENTPMIPVTVIHKPNQIPLPLLLIQNSEMADTVTIPRMTDKTPKIICVIPENINVIYYENKNIAIIFHL